jgi:hypothetical protein
MKGHRTGKSRERKCSDASRAACWSFAFGALSLKTNQKSDGKGYCKIKPQ